jgi:hypothetical protein
MNTRPILFSAPMVRALLEGHKTQTRRIIKDPAPTQFPDWFAGAKWDPEFGMVVVDSTGTGRGTWSRECSYGLPGDLLWVREAWQSLVEHDHLSPSKLPEGSDIQYPATYDGWVSKGRPSIHMCQWMSRITLEITGLRVERLQAITEEDAKAEGMDIVRREWSGGDSCADQMSARELFEILWEHINGKESWAANPWVWVVEFKRIKP